MRIVVEDIVTDLLDEIERVEANNRTPKEIVLTGAEWEEFKREMGRIKGWFPYIGKDDTFRFDGIPIRVLDE